VKRFGYVFDPLFLVCCALYAANRWLIKPHCHVAFFHNWFNDVLLIPCALPPLLLVHRWWRLRGHDQPPTLAEVSAHVLGWSVLFEVIGPRLMPTTGDPWDAVAYAGGGAAAFFCWRSCYNRSDTTGADFDRLAPHYGWMERLLAGRKLQRCRGAFLQTIPVPRRALVAGPGHGAFVAELLRAHPHLHCTCVDSSAGMLQAARARLRADGLDESRAEFIQADLLDWAAPDGKFDLIVTHFFLDCFRPEQLERLMPKLSAAAAPKACWLLADFQEPAAGPAKWRARAMLEIMYVFFRWAAALPASQLTPPDSLLARQGFALGQRRTFDWGLLHSDLWIRADVTPSH
jgi:ubiquinone/menaquinone biosynthesis C-methylase UbiE